MDAEPGVQVKRVSTRKRSRDSLRSLLTPARKRGGPGPQQGPGGGPGPQQGPQKRSFSSIMADIKAVEVGLKQTGSEPGGNLQLLPH